MRRQRLSDLELAIMGVVWDLGESSSREIVEAVQKLRPLAPTTIRTVLANIERKGFLDRVATTDRGLRYRPSRKRGLVARDSLRVVVQRLFGGSSKLAILQLLDTESLDEADLDEIRRMIAAKKKALS